MLRLLFTFSLILINLPLLIAQSQSNPQVKGCYATLENDTLTLGNKVITQKFLWNKGALINISIENKTDNQKIDFTDEKPQELFPVNTELIKSTFRKTVVNETKISCAYLEAEVHKVYQDYELKTVFRIYPETPAIATDYYLLNKNEKLNFDALQTRLATYSFPSRHLKTKAVAFFDQTDSHNNLVFEQELLSFGKALTQKGNILTVKDLLNKTDVFFIKEAPCSFVQLHYPGYDFKVENEKIEVAGIGILPNDLPTDDWIKTYSVVIGMAGPDELAMLSAIRKYQKKLRKHLPGRDDMIMMNTWGDRNRDASIGEAFIKKEVDACAKYGITHFQIDDGWQEGLSQNSADQSGKLWDQWDKASWQPNKERFPNGFKTVVDYAKAHNVQLGLWFHPSNASGYENWKQDADIVAGLYKDYGIRYFKIDGIKLPTKKAEINLKNFFEEVLEQTGNEVVFNVDATANNRTGYHYMNQYGNIFLENRYTDWGKYYPFWTLRNLWMLAKYVPAENLQIEFLNKWRNEDKYPTDDLFAPSKIPFAYQFAITLAAQPLAWFEGSNLPKEAEAIIPMINAYKHTQTELHEGTILPVGEEPDGSSWTGFQSVKDGQGFFVVFRELNNQHSKSIQTWLPANTKVRLKSITGNAKNYEATTDSEGQLTFTLDEPHSFAVYKYSLQ